MRASIWTLIGAVSGFLSVAMGAFGAHSLAPRLSEKAISIYQTAAQYQMYHALALIGLGLWAGQHPNSHVGITGWAFILGSLLFSGSLYALAITDVKILGAVTPFGGVAFLVGWIYFAVLIWRA